MNLKIPSSDKKIPYKIFQKQNLNSLLKQSGYSGQIEPPAAEKISVLSGSFSLFFAISIIYGKYKKKTYIELTLNKFHMSI